MRLARLRIGCVKYLNARPLIRGWTGVVDYDHPSALCQKLADGTLDAALVSSLEYLRRPLYRIVDGVSISAKGPVYSVIVTHARELSRVHEIEIDPASQTSVALLRCLLQTRGLAPRLVPGLAEATVKDDGPTGARDRPNRIQLLIGDQAIRYRQRHPQVEVLDLGEEWMRATRLPFVFALWLIRREVADPAEIACALRSRREENLAHLDSLVVEQTGFDSDFCRRYFSHHLNFDFQEPEKAGLREFHRRCLGAAVDVAPQFSLQLV